MNTHPNKLNNLSNMGEELKRRPANRYSHFVLPEKFKKGFITPQQNF
jgi:hypothetical protein